MATEVHRKDKVSPNIKEKVAGLGAWVSSHVQAHTHPLKNAMFHMSSLDCFV